MGIITIIAGGLELDIVRETLTIKKENNAFITDFKVTHSTRPFLIVENEKTKIALGPRDMTSVLKRKVVPVMVIEMGERFYGELQLLTNIRGFRKCNIKYGTDLIKIMDKKLLDLLPVVSVIPGETNPVPFSEEGFSVVPGYENWQTYPVQFATRIYPEVKYQFPQLAWPKKFGPIESADDEWFTYKGYYNSFGTLSEGIYFRNNFFAIEGQNVSILNQNLPSPQLFLLAIFDYAFANAGYTIGGSFVESDFARRLLVLSTKANLCKINLAPEVQYIDFNDLQDQGVFFFYTRFNYDFIPLVSGTHIFDYFVHEQLKPGGITQENHHSQLIYIQDGQGVNVYFNINNPDHLFYQGQFEITVSDEQVNKPIKIQWLRWYQDTGEPEQFLIRWSVESKVFNMMHPTIPLGRYAPEWSLSDAINEVKNFFSLDITFDNLAKKVYFNFAADLLTKPTQHIANKSLALDDYDTPEFTAFVLKNGNNQDNFLYIDKAGTTLNQNSESDLVGKMESKFKLVPNNGNTADISEMDDKEGVGLMIYDPKGAVNEIPLIASAYNGRTLAWEGGLGIYNMYWKRTLQFRLNASMLEIKGPFTEVEISKMDKAQKLYIQNQSFIIYAMEYSETSQGFYTVTLQLGSINF